MPCSSLCVFHRTLARTALQTEWMGTYTAITIIRLKLQLAQAGVVLTYGYMGRLGRLMQNCAVHVRICVVWERPKPHPCLLPVKQEDAATRYAVCLKPQTYQLANFSGFSKHAPSMRTPRGPLPHGSWRPPQRAEERRAERTR